MKTTHAIVTLLAFTLPATAAEPAGASLTRIAASAPAIMIPPHTAVLMKRELDGYALFVDVDSAPDRSDGLQVDALVPLLATDAPEQFNAAFLEEVDRALAAKRLRWTDGVVLVSRSAFTAMQAAELLREHGYGLVFAVTSPWPAGR